MAHKLEDERIPLGYLITFRTYGTWLHGDKRGSVNDIHGLNMKGRLQKLWEKPECELVLVPPDFKTAAINSSTRHPFFQTRSSPA